MKKKNQIHYTNESLSKKFISNFDLVNYAISLAENMIHTGRETRVKSEIQNRAMLILQEIQEGKDYLDEVIVKEIITDPRIAELNGSEASSQEGKSEKRKSRIVGTHKK